MKSRDTLIIFLKNPVPGKVKTRLAATIGEARALSVYNELLLHTFIATKNIDANKIVYYSNHIDDNDRWNGIFSKAIQRGNTLGDKMLNAFSDELQNNIQKAIIIGTDCPDISHQIIKDAFQKLNSTDIVIGPAFDGGYYLLGMKKVHEILFENIEWSTNKVLSETKQRCRAAKLSYAELPMLHDIDVEADLVHLKSL